MWLKEFLRFGPDRPTWAFVADNLLASPDFIPDNTQPRDKSLRVNPFLQTWKNLEKKHG
ncbi:hypothetical protein HDZ31DRAFT_68429 [Schizophyllum fasciatum]